MNNNYTFSTIDSPINYKVGDVIESKSENTKGICTGFCHGDTCVMIDGKCYGGKSYFRKATKPE